MSISAPKICSVCGRSATKFDGGRGFRLLRRAVEEQRLKNTKSERFNPETHRHAHDLLRRINNEAPLVCVLCVGRHYSPPPPIAKLFAEVDAFLGPEQDSAPTSD